MARFSGAWGPARWLKCWSEDGNPAFHGTVQLRLRKPSNAPQGQRIGGYGSVLRPGTMGLRRNKKLNLACRKPARVAGSRPQGPVGQVSRGLGARAPRAWGPARQGPGAFSPQKPPNLSNYDFFANLLVGAWRRRGCRLKRLLRRWGPGGKRSRDTPRSADLKIDGKSKRGQTSTFDVASDAIMLDPAYNPSTRSWAPQAEAYDPNMYVRSLGIEHPFLGKQEKCKKSYSTIWAQSLSRTSTSQTATCQEAIL